MEGENKVPLLLEYLFGEDAEAAQRGTSERLLVWAEAFDDWLAERRANYSPSTALQSRLAWQRLLMDPRTGKSGAGSSGRCGAGMPWELGEGDIQAHVEWMESEGYAPSTICYALGYLANFYNWCDERQIDPECEPGFNPAAGVKRPRVERYATAKLLSAGEVERLLGILQRDDSALGKRDYAMSLARLRLGVALGAIRKLQWGQLRPGEQEVRAGMSHKPIHHPTDRGPVLDRTARGEAGQARDKPRNKYGAGLGAGTGEEGELALSNRRLVEEIAAVRYSLRRVLALALESEDTAEYVHLVEIYGNGCLRLVRLLKREGRELDRLESYVRELVDAARKEIPKLFGWRD